MNQTNTLKSNRRWLHLLAPVLLLAGLLVLTGIRNSPVPEPYEAIAPANLPSPTPSVTPTPAWWNERDFATPTLKKLPGLPRPKFKNAADQEEPGKAVPFEVISCPTEGVKISDIRTASGPWWHISGTASIPDLWYWKAEISADGANWASLYRSEQAMVNGILVRLNLTTVPAEARQVRLTAVDRTGNYPEPCVVNVVR